MELILHIGTGKTGSSSIQSLLTREQSELNKQGIFYMGYMFEHCSNKQYSWQRHSGTEQFAKLEADIKREQLADVLMLAREQAVKLQCHTLLWSNEALVDMPAIADLIDKLWKDPVRVICFVRRHDDYSVSAFKQWGIKHKIYKGEVPSFKEFIARFPLNLFDRINHWNLPHWDFQLLNYHFCKDVVASFMDAAGVSLTLPDSMVKENGGESLAQLAIAAIVNSGSEQKAKPFVPELNAPQQRRDEDWFFSKLPSQEDIDVLFERTRHDRENLNTLLNPEQKFDESESSVSLYSKEDVDNAFAVVRANLVDNLLKQESFWKSQYKFNSLVLKRRIPDLQKQGMSQFHKIEQLEARIVEQHKHIETLVGHINSMHQSLVSHNQAIVHLNQRNSIFITLRRKLRRMLGK